MTETPDNSIERITLKDPEELENTTSVSLYIIW